MPLAASTGRGASELTDLYCSGPKVDPQNVALIGVRDIDPAERVLIREAGIDAYTIADVDRLGAAEVIDRAVARLRDRVDVVHVSFDVDALDPLYAPGVGTPVPGGLQYREVHLIMETLAASGLVGSLEVVEINPILDNANLTAEVAVQIVLSALGKTIL